MPSWDANPPQTPVSTTQKLIHDNPSVFPNPREFIPERWLDPAERKRLEKYFQPFGRGSRSCLGIHLAYSSLYLSIAQIFGTFDMKLYETTQLEIEQFYDFFSPFPASMKGVRVLLS
jgi:cytochrome P450